jgi:hypothetical protein
MFYCGGGTPRGEHLPPLCRFETTHIESLTMIAQFNVPEPADRHHDLTEKQPRSSPQIIDFFAARNRILSENNGNIGPVGCGYTRNVQRISLRRELLHPLVDPMEDWINSLISAAALASLPIGILSLPSAPAAKRVRSQNSPISQADSFIVTQKPR